MFDYKQKTDFDPGKIVRIDNVLDAASPIFFGYDIEEQFAKALERSTHDIPVDRLFLLTDRTIFDLFGESFLRRLSERFPDTVPYLLPEGEQCKKGSGDYLISVDKKIVQSVLEAFINKYGSA